MILGQGQLQKLVEEINQQEEESRRAEFKKRHDIYRDGGAEYLLEELVREFGTDSIKEMRIAPINLLKKIVNKKSTLYKKPPVRAAANEKDQALVDYYVNEFDLDVTMQKAQRYFHLFSNLVIYLVPKEDRIQIRVVPPYLYSVVTNQLDQTFADAYLFNSFTEEGLILPFDDVPSATGAQGYTREDGVRESGDRINSQEDALNPENRNYIFWSDQQHMTLDASGSPMIDPNKDHEEQFLNPWGEMPIVNVAKDRDSEFWATQGKDMISLTMTIQKAWTDLLTYSKHQGYGIPVFIGEEEPTKLEFGVNRAIFLKQKPDGPTPSFSFVSSNPPIGEQKDMIMELLGLLLSTNDMNPKEIGGTNSARNFSSGFQAMIENADILEAREADKPVFRTVEKQLWHKIRLIHNWMFDFGVLNEEAQALGKFSDELEVGVEYSDIKPLESESDRIGHVKELMSLGLLTKRQAIKKLQPSKSDEEIEQDIEQISQETQERVTQARAQFGD